MYGKEDSIICMMKFTEILKNEPDKAIDYIETNNYRMHKDDIVNILKEVLYGMKIGCYHPQYEQIMTDIQIELDEKYNEDYQECQQEIDEVNKSVIGG